MSDQCLPPLTRNDSAASSGDGAGEADHTTTWRFVLPLLERRFTIYAMDRRGRGGSGDAPAYELQRGEQSYIFAPERFRNMRTPTLLLVGGDSPPRERENANGVANVLPDAQVVVLPGQQHACMYAAPELFLREVVRFLEG